MSGLLDRIEEAASEPPTMMTVNRYDVLALVAVARAAEELEGAVADLLANVLLPTDNTAEDNRRIIGLDVAAIHTREALSRFWNQHA